MHVLHIFTAKWIISGDTPDPGTGALCAFAMELYMRELNVGEIVSVSGGQLNGNGGSAGAAGGTVNAINGAVSAAQNAAAAVGDALDYAAGFVGGVLKGMWNEA